MYRNISSAHPKTHPIALIVQRPYAIKAFGLASNGRIAFMGIAMEMRCWIVLKSTTVKPIIGSNGFADILFGGF
jgi:hypothetical protein